MPKKGGKFIAGLLAGGIIAWVVRGFLKTTKKISSVGSRSRRKAENKQKILIELKRVDKIRNDDVQSLLGVSDATAERYLSEIEASGAIVQVGNKGRWVYYKLK